MRVLKWLLVLVAVAGLIAVRMVEGTLFYDPFQFYFHEANKDAVFPNFIWSRLILGHFFRFGLNLLFSVLIVQLIFSKLKWTIQAGVMMVAVFLIALPIYLYCISTHFEIGYLFSFYMRRFVIQPIILLLIIPLFYYRQHLTRFHRL